MVRSSAMEKTSLWVDWAKEVATYFVILVIPLWKLIDSYFKYQSKKDQEFIKTVVNETLKAALIEIKNDINELKENRIQDMKEFNGTVLNIYKELKK